MTGKLLAKGENIPQIDYNEVVRRVLRNDKDLPPSVKFLEIYGQYDQSVDAFGIFEFFDNTPTIATDREDMAVVVGVQTHSSSPFFVTNAEAATIANQDTSFNLMVPGFAYKIRCKAGQTINVHDEIGPEDNQTHVHSNGSGLLALSPNYTQNSQDYVWVTPLASSGVKYGKLLEDATASGYVWAIGTDRDGTEIPGTEFQIYNWQSIITGCLVDHPCQTRPNGEFVQSPQCKPDDCFSNGTITGLSLSATENTALPTSPAHRIDGTNLNSLTVGTLPSGLTYTPDATATDGGEITGTPAVGTAGTHIIKVTATSTKTGPAPASGDCSIGRVLVITIAEA